MSVSDGPRFCASCGAPQAPGAQFCASCGAQVAGATPPQAQPPQAPPPASPPPSAAPAPPVAAWGAPPPGGPPPVPQAAPSSGGLPRWLVPVLAVVLVLAIVATGLVWFGKDDEAGAGEIFLEPAATMGDDAFGDQSYEAPTIPTTAPPTTARPPASHQGGSTTVRSVSGDQVGLYGGTQNQSRCDVGQMIDFLRANRPQAEAFVSALNSDSTLRWSGGTRVNVSQLPDYLNELTPITLTVDTRVTNHGFRDGNPVPLQAVLQAGTAVLVDSYGVPRTRCACGNPLIPPARINTTPTYTGPQWPGFDPTTIVVVTEVNVAIDIYILVDLTTGDLFERPVGTKGDNDQPVDPPDTTPTTEEPPETTPTTEGPELGTGDVQVTLTWTGDLDLDLHVIDPDGTEIYYAAAQSPSGGQLDVDQIPAAGQSGTHVENVFWPTGGAPAGDYEAFVVALSGSNDTSSDFTLTVIVNGEEVAGTSGNLATGSTSERVPFDF